MTRRFVIGIEGLAREEERQFRDYLRDQGSWWHWIDNLWLFVTEDETINVRSIRDQAKEINNDIRCLVLEIPGDIDWAGSGKKNAKGKSMYDWLKTTWAEK